MNKISSNFLWPTLSKIRVQTRNEKMKDEGGNKSGLNVGSEQKTLEKKRNPSIGEWKQLIVEAE